MGRYILRRVVQAVVVLLAMSFVIYSLIGLMPGDPIDAMVASNPGATPEVVAHLRAIYGLDQPLMLRYWHWLLDALHGDFGFSRVHSQPVLRCWGRRCGRPASSFCSSSPSPLFCPSPSASSPR